MATFTLVVTDKLKVIELIIFREFNFNKQNICNDFLMRCINNIIYILLCYYATNDFNI